MNRVLTGETRLREQKRWFRRSLLVLQIKVHYTGEVMTNAGGRVEVDDYDSYVWEDVRVTDITMLALTIKLRIKKVDK